MSDNFSFFLRKDLLVKDTVYTLLILACCWKLCIFKGCSVEHFQEKVIKISYNSFFNYQLVNGFLIAN